MPIAATALVGKHDGDTKAGSLIVPHHAGVGGRDPVPPAFAVQRAPDHGETAFEQCPGELFAPVYRRRGLAAKNLSRTTEDSGTVVVPLVPWSIAGVFMAGTLGVETLSYAPWAVMCYLGVVFALVYGFTGFAIAPRIAEDETVPGS